MTSQANRASVPRRPTMVDVAKHARVSLKTVSRVVNNEPVVGRELVDRADPKIGTVENRLVADFTEAEQKQFLDYLLRALKAVTD